MGIVNLVENMERQTDQDTQDDTMNKVSVGELDDTSTQVLEHGDHTSKDKDRKIVLAGPLSMIYTKALNMTYAKEDIASTILQLGTKTKLKTVNDVVDSSGQAIDLDDISDDSTDIGLYVYCCTSDGKADVVIDAENAIVEAEGKGYKDIVLSMECVDGAVSRACIDLDRKMSSKGIRVVYSRRRTIDIIEQFVR